MDAYRYASKERWKLEEPREAGGCRISVTWCNVMRGDCLQYVTVWSLRIGRQSLLELSTITSVTLDESCYAMFSLCCGKLTSQYANQQSRPACLNERVVD